MKKYISFRLLFMILLTVAVGVVFNLNENAAFSTFTSRIFSWIRSFLNNFSLSLVFIFWGVLLFAYFRHRKGLHIHHNTFSWIAGLLQPFIWAGICFYWLWGFNYSSPAPEQKILTSVDTISDEALLISYQTHTMQLSQMRDSLDFHKTFLNRELVSEKSKIWTTSIKKILQPLGYNVKGNASIIMAFPRGILLRFGTAGFYNFVLARPTVDPGLHPLQLPFTSMHELAHAYGVADEASANFTGYIACISSKDKLTQYSAELSFWRSLRAICHRRDSAATRTITEFVSKDVKNDLIAIRRQMDKYPDLIPALRDNFYDLFLKSQGVNAGLGSYELYVPMVLQWEKGQKKIKI